MRVASSKEYLDFIMEQLSGLNGITSKQMMGEYILYINGRIFGGIYDDRFLVKPTKSAMALMPDADRELPYEGAKEMLLVDNVDNRDFLTGLVTAMYDELPAPKQKKMRRERHMKHIILILLAALLCLTGCSAEEKMTYHQISQEEAKQRMTRDDGHIIVDVRRQDEYVAGHIPGAILIPNESIGTEQPEQLPDKDQIILIYCRSGRRSKEAAQKLANMGYTNIYEFGGIIDWTGETVTNEPAMSLKIGETEVSVTWEENPSVEALKDLLPLTIEMSMYGGFEQVGSIGQEIISNDAQTKTEPGDIVLYSSDQIVIFYGNNSWAYTRLGHVDLTQEEMSELLANGDVTITISAGAEE